jgi:TonB family protein
MNSVLVARHPERRAFIISLAAHALLFLLMYLAIRNNLQDTLQVRLVVEMDSRPQKIEIPEENPTEIERPNRRHKDRTREAAKSSRKSATGAKHNQNAESATPEDPWSRYEQRMQARKSSTNENRSTAHGESTRWGKEKLGKTGKEGLHEAVVVPRGSSSSNTRWKKGAARRLLSLPAIDYPESIRKKSGQGQVELRIEVNGQGQVASIEIVKSSGHTRLDMNARNAYRNAVFSPSPSGESATGVVVVTFRMRDN